MENMTMIKEFFGVHFYPFHRVPSFLKQIQLKIKG